MTIRTARSRTSTGYLVDVLLDMTPTFPRNGVTGLSLRRVLRTLRPLRSATIEINGMITTIPPALSADEQAVLNALKPPPARH